MSKDIKNIVIVGGGSAGWMTASTLVKFLPNIKISLIESENVPTIGVGESTQANLKNWMNILGIKQEDFMLETDAGLKYGIKYKNFYEKNDEGYFYPFGDGLFSEKNTAEMWQFKKLLYPSIGVDDYCKTFYSQMVLMEQNKISNNEDAILDNFNSYRDVSFHFDAIKFALYLRDNFAKPLGVEHVIAEVVSAEVTENGIDFITLSDGSNVHADLFVDCTGFKALLIGEYLKEPFVSFEKELPTNRAWAIQLPYSDNKEEELINYTTATALSSGWVWAAPLWSRIGTGYVYSDKFISPEDALEEFKEHLREVRGTERITDDLKFRDISFNAGIRERTWVKNVVSIGLSASFLEPMEGNGLYSIHEFVIRLVKILGKGFINQWDRDSYNWVINDMTLGFKEFIQSHYFLSKRSDSEFWQYMTETSPVEKLFDKTVEHTRVKRLLIYPKLFTFGTLDTSGNSGWHCTMIGMNYSQFGKDTLNQYNIFENKKIEDQVKEFTLQTSKNRVKWNSAINDSPSHFEYLKDLYDADK
jgi:tryptophan halogenase